MRKTKIYPVQIKINGEWRETAVQAGETLLHTLREKLGQTEVKEGCGKGDCGACTVLLNGKAVNACLTRLPSRPAGGRSPPLRGSARLKIRIPCRKAS
jgi:carbon-monoxide dehydrogenase small subunit